MTRKTIHTGEVELGQGPFTIDNITTNAVVVLNIPGRLGFAVLNFGVLDSANPYDEVKMAVRRYVQQYNMDETEGGVHALVVGGDYQEHREHFHGQDRYVVKVDHRLARNKLEEALMLAGVSKVRTMQEDRRATKSIQIHRDGRIDCYQSLDGIQCEEPMMSEDTYYLMCARDMSND
jgi:hypothetical protein